MKTKVCFDNNPALLIDSAVAEIKPSSVHLLADANTACLVLPHLQDSRIVKSAQRIVVKSGEMNKNIESVAQVWKALVEGGANRKSLLINVGGGVVTDLGGFAAATFKRGIRYINLSTSLLGAVDASIGGKTGVDFDGLKNEVGAFHSPEAVFISAELMSTLNFEDILSGYGEMIKHALLHSPQMTDRILAYNIEHYNPETLLPLIKESVEVKAAVVEQDPYESGLRKILNFGHTAGHAFESLAIKRNAPIPHGYAVAYGIIVELVLSHNLKGFPSNLMQSIVGYVKDHYGTFAITCHDYPQLLEFMRHDKKNVSQGINFTLLSVPGQPTWDNIVSEEEIKVALDIYCDLML